ncbi:MAG: serine/threonine-protein kinase [Polyangiaceae bacterium]
MLHKDQRPDFCARQRCPGLSHPGGGALRLPTGHQRRSGLLLGDGVASRERALLGSRRLALPDCLTLLRRVCSGLAVAHQMGVVHRDLKPANILIPDGSLAAAKLIDFGIARRRFDPRLTERGLLIGTLAYMSPEQARGASQIEPTSDVFSLGSVVYKCMTGEAPFGSGDSTAILAKVLLEDPTPVGERVPGVPPGFDAMVSRMLAKAPEGRPRDAAAVLALADALATDEQSSGAAGITIREQRVVWVVLTGGNVPDDGETQERPPELASTEDPSGGIGCDWWVRPAAVTTCSPMVPRWRACRRRPAGRSAPSCARRRSLRDELAGRPSRWRPGSA